LRPGLKILLFISICFLILNSAYVGAYAEPTLFYVTNVFAHLAAGSVIGMALLWAAWRERHSHLAFSIGAALCVLLALVSGGQPGENSVDHRRFLEHHGNTTCAGALIYSARESRIPWCCLMDSSSGGFETIQR